MKYWCYYTDVVRYLEKLEALHAPKTKAPAYLIWQDDGGPSMIVGPGVEWYRGDGPPPNIDAITISLITRAATVRERSVRTPSSRKKPHEISSERSACVRPNRKKTRGCSTELSARTPPNRKKPHEISAERSFTETRPSRKKPAGFTPSSHSSKPHPTEPLKTKPPLPPEASKATRAKPPG